MAPNKNLNFFTTFVYSQKVDFILYTIGLTTTHCACTVRTRDMINRPCYTVVYTVTTMCIVTKGITTISYITISDTFSLYTTISYGKICVLKKV